MTETLAPPTLHPSWDLNLEAVACQRCRWRYLAPPGAQASRCPNCGDPLENALLDPEAAASPELVAPFEVTPEALEKTLTRFVQHTPFPPEDLNLAALHQRLTAVYLPVWLVDANVTAVWQVEAGYDYHVVSHQEEYSRLKGAWESKEVEEQRTRWEPRVGRLKRPYHNVVVPAIEDAPALEKKVGAFQYERAQPYGPGCLENGAIRQRFFVRLPDFPPKEAWSEASAAFQKTVSDDCRQAVAADRLRQFQWNARFTDLNWTLLLLPVYTTYYHSDQDQTYPLFINGQTGQMIGLRRASMTRAKEASLRLLLSGIVLFLLGNVLDLLFPGIRLAGGVTIPAVLVVAGIGAMLGALVPIVLALDENHRPEVKPST